MKQLKNCGRQSLALTLVVMLMLSMAAGVFTLSVSADETSLPELLNTPTMNYCEPSEGSHELILWSYSTYDLYDSLFQTISLVIDDENSDYSLSDISSISYWYNDPELGSFSSDVYWYQYLPDFDTLLVDISASVGSTDNSNLYKKILGDMHTYTRYYEYNGETQSQEVKGYDDQDYDTLYDSLKRSTLILRIGYYDGASQYIPVEIKMENNTKTFIPVNLSTINAVVIEFAHSTNINDESFYELENAIFHRESLYDDTSNRYYVDVESDDDIVIPLDNMSSRLTLEQTRIGNNIVYNTANSVSLLSNVDGEPDFVEGYTWSYNGLDYLLTPNYTYDFYTTIRDSNIAIVELNGIFYSKEHLPSKYYMDFVEQGNIVQNAFTGVPGTDYDQSAIDSLTKSLLPYAMYIVFSDSEEISGEENVLDFAKTIRDYYESDTISDDDKAFLDGNDFKLYVRCKRKVSSSTSNFNKAFTGISGIYTLIDAIENGGYTDSSYNYYDFNTLVYCSSSTSSAADGQAITDSMNNIAQVINNWNSNAIIPNKSYVPNKDGITFIPFYDMFNVTEYYRFNNIPLEYQISGNGENSLARVFAKAGKYSKYWSYSVSEVKTDTYQNGCITFNIDDLDWFQKGIHYSVINQVSMSGAPYNDADGVRMGYSSNLVHGSDLNNSNIYYLNGDNVTSAITAYNITSTSSSYSSGYALLRHTEYKWGEMVFVSRPDPVENLAFDRESGTLSWSKPLDEGAGKLTKAIRTGEDENGLPTFDYEYSTRSDDYIRVSEYNVKLYDDNGTVLYETTVDRGESDEISLNLPSNLIKNNKKYTAAVSCTNVVGESDGSAILIEGNVPKSSVSAKIYTDAKNVRIGDTVTWTNTVTNNGGYTLHDIEIEFIPRGEITVDREYKESDDTATIIVSSLEPGESVTMKCESIVRSEDIRDNYYYGCLIAIAEFAGITVSKYIPLVNDNADTPDTPDAPEIKETQDTPDVPIRDSDTDNDTDVDSDYNFDTDSDTDTEPFEDTEIDTDYGHDTDTDSDSPYDKDTPDTPDRPDTSDVPWEQDPNTPDAPDMPDTSDVPWEPDPNTPDAPDMPDTSDVPWEPDPNTPSEPAPDRPDEPVDAENLSFGDINGDGYITAADALTILRFSVNLETFTETQRKLADVDNDGYVTAADAMDVLRYSVGLHDNENIGKRLN